MTRNNINETVFKKHPVNLWIKAQAKKTKQSEGMVRKNLIESALICHMTLYRLIWCKGNPTATSVRKISKVTGIPEAEIYIFHTKAVYGEV